MCVITTMELQERQQKVALLPLNAWALFVKSFREEGEGYGKLLNLYEISKPWKRCIGSYISVKPNRGLLSIALP